MSSTAEQHASEVRQGARFEFGRNWRRFLSTLNDERIAIATRSLTAFLELPRLDGLSFLDVGSGSGLFSLVARQLGATVTSFDYDTHSVACTNELRRRYFPDDSRWRVMQGSVLERDFMTGLGTFDIVYSWGVLHHTGAMHAAFANLKPLVAVGGRLFIAIYNDLGAVTDRWWRVKRRYNRLPRGVRLLYALNIIGASEARIFAGHLRRRDLPGYWRSWTDYQRLSTRGMNRWHDWIDWIGGFPYERAGIEAVVDVFAADGFSLTKLGDRSSGYGCNEFVFRRVAAAGTWIDQPVPGSRLMSRRFGQRVDIAAAPAGARIAAPPQSSAAAGTWLLLQGDRLAATIDPPGRDGTIAIPATVTDGAAQDETPLVAVQARVDRVAPPFAHQRGNMWTIAAPELEPLADNAAGREDAGGSPVFVFENGRQLGLPHSLHDDVARHGGGRCSHWGAAIYFSSSDNSDPNLNGREYALVYPVGGDGTGERRTSGPDVAA